MVLNDVFWTVKEFGLVRSERQFSMQFLNKSECYMRVLRHSQNTPSVLALAVCAEQLQRHAATLSSASSQKSAQLSILAERCYDAIRRIARQNCEVLEV